MLAETYRADSISHSINPFLHFEMSELTNPTPADWELWEPLIRDRYKKEPLRVIRQEMEDNGLKVT